MNLLAGTPPEFSLSSFGWFCVIICSVVGFIFVLVEIDWVIAQENIRKMHMHERLYGKLPEIEDEDG